jgi:hypothetical protein
MLKNILMAALIAASLTLSGCNLDGYSKEGCRASVIREAQTDRVVCAPDKDYTFIVSKMDGSVWIYKTMNTSSTEVTDRCLLFSPLTK